MRIQNIKATLKAAVQVASLLLFGAAAAFGQQTVNLTAAPTTAPLPDGSAVPMWGYNCGTAVSTATATCAKLNPNAPAATTTTPAGWSPVVITVPYVATGTSLTINLTNSLTFTGGSIPTSIMIVGQIGGGLGTHGSTCADANGNHGVTCTPSPDHSALVTNTVTWPTVGSSPGFTPPGQGPRVQSFATEVAAGATTSLTWSALKPGTYLLESGTHPSIQVPMGLIGMLVVTTPPSGATAGTAYPATSLSAAVTYNADVNMLFSEIDPIQNRAVQTAVNTAGFSETMVWSAAFGTGCASPSSPTYNQCYPPAVNYTPVYYLINGVGFDKTNGAASLFAASDAGAVTGIPNPGTVLVRMVNAGLRMHVPSIVGSLTSQTVSAPTVATTVHSGFSLEAEDGNALPGLPRIQSEVFMAAGKVYDVSINVPATVTTALPVYDRELSLSGGTINRDAGMLAYLGINGAALPAVTNIAAGTAAVTARDDIYNSVVPGQTLIVSDPGKGVIANDTNVYGVTLVTPVAGLTLSENGTFSYLGAPTTFTYCANGTVTAGVCSSGKTAIAHLNAATIEGAGGITCAANSFTSTMATYLIVKTPGVLATCVDGAGYPLTVSTTIPATFSGGTVAMDANGGFTAKASGAGTYTLGFTVQNSQGSTKAASVSVTFQAASNLAVTVLDGYDKATTITDYRWIIEEDRTFYIDPTKVQNTGTNIVPTLGVNFHTSYMPFVAQGCTGPVSCEAGQTVVNPLTGAHGAAVCDVGNGVCRPDTAGAGFTAVMPSQVHLDPTKRYYISIFPGDAANPFGTGNFTAQSALNCAINPATGQPWQTPGGIVESGCGHGMGGAPIGIDPNTHLQATAVTVLVQPNPYPTGKLSVFVFEDDEPLNGEHDSVGNDNGVNQNAEPGLGGFQIHLWDAMGGNGDFTGQMGFDMFNQPLVNGLAGTIDPTTGVDACPISANPLTNGNGAGGDPTATGLTGFIVTCPQYEADGVTPSPIAGQAIINNLMPGRWGAIATPGADRIARGEEWLQTNTLDGQKAHDVFTRIGEPSYFQEFGPASFHVSIGFANPAIINARKPAVCNGSDPTGLGPGTGCNNSLIGKVTSERLSRTPDERLYSSGSHAAYYWSQCYVSFGDPDGEDFAFTKCADDGTFKLTGLPSGNWRVTVFDQWNDLLVDGLSTPVALAGGATVNMGDIASTQWQANLYTRTFIDDNKDGISQSTEAGIPFANVAVRLRDGSLENLLVTDFTGTANFNETFPLFSWYTVETDTTRYKNTGTHVVYDVGGPADGSASCGVSGYPPCGTSKIGANLANTQEIVSVPTNLRVPGALYCKDADCSTHTTGILGGPASSDPPSVCTTATATPPITTCSTKLSSGRIDPPWVGIEGWQGFPGQNNFLEFGKEPYVAGENGGIKGHVVYASTRPFDDPQMLVQTQWTNLVPNVTINLYQEGFAADGVTPTLKLVDTTKTSSWDDFAQGFRADGVTPNMNCPGQGAATGPIPDLFFYSLFNQPNYLNTYNAAHGGPAATALPNNSQFKCYDGMHNWNQIQPAPYDGVYKFPSVTAVDANGKPTTAGTNCTICTPNHAVASTDLYYGIPQLPIGKYVVEVVVPPGYELVKEEDKNILMGDNYVAPVTQEFPGVGGSIFIIPDQASVAEYSVPNVNSVSGNASVSAAGYNQFNPQNPTQSFGMTAGNGIVPGFIPEPSWPCVGEARVVPDYMSLFPQTHQAAPFAGATRNLCDRKEVTLSDQVGAIAKFWVYTSTHIASKFTGGITDDYTSEFDPFSPQFGEKFSPPDLPVSVKDWTGTEISRIYADHWGSYDGMTYSTWEVNPPNPTGYAPTMMVFCMNDPGPILDTNPTSKTHGKMITDPLYSTGYSQFCYELPFMPGTTQYLDTPVVPTSAFAGAGYNNVDCYYPTLTPAIQEVDSSDGLGPWVKTAGHTLTITALGDTVVPNYAYSGPSATTAPYNQKTITRHYGFGGTKGTVSIGGVNVPAGTITTWTDLKIVLIVPTGVPPCPVQQQTQYGGSTAQCGQLVITTAASTAYPAGQQSIDTVTVTIGGKTPHHVLATDNVQAAIDAADPGDMLILDPAFAPLPTAPATTSCVGVITNTTTCGETNATHDELLVMWKPVRLQGVGAVSSVINANTHPAGKLDAWRQKINCLFGLAENGAPISSGGTISGGGVNAVANPFDPTGVATCSDLGPGFVNFDESGSAGNPFNATVDRLPLEAVLGWNSELNGNLAELLQEPSLLGALEGAGITVLGKGVNIPSDQYNSGLLSGFPTGTTLLTASNCAPTSTSFYGANFFCNPSSIDAVGITESSQGGGGIFLHGWNHKMQIANNRIISNAGTLSGGINVGQGEFPPATIKGGATNAAPYEAVSDFCATGRVPFTGTATIPTNATEPYCFSVDLNMHNNDISLNSSTGDELFSATPAGAGGVSICTGADYYKFNFNWVCGNLSSGDGGGVGQIGFSYSGDIEHNSILFNQSLNPTIPANGGGLLVQGAPDADITCPGSAVVDTDCAPPSSPGQIVAQGIGPSDGTGPNLTINANLIMGNSAEAGTGGGVNFQQVNGSDVVALPRTPQYWNSVNFTNNIVANNIAGWDGAGISLVDSLNVTITNNTVIGNNSTASAGILFTTLGAPEASQGGTNCTNGTGTASCPQVAGLVAIQNSAILSANLVGVTVTCPPGHYVSASATNGTCRTVSIPQLNNDLFWQNSSYYIGVGALSAAFQQNVVTMYNAFTTTPVPSQPTADATTANGGGAIITGGTGACAASGTAYWDLGVRGDSGPTNHATVTLAPSYSIITSIAGYNGATLHNLASNPTVVSQYCNGARTPPEFAASGFAVPPGISDATVPNPIFNLTPVATVDEGNNWVNLRWGPLSLLNPVNSTAAANVVLGNYALATGSPAIDVVPVAITHPTTDFFGNPRPEVATATCFDIGAVENQTAGGTCAGGGGGGTTSATFTPTSWTVSQTRNCPGSGLGGIIACALDPVQVFTLRNTGTTTLTGITAGTLVGANSNEYSIVRLLSSCGTATGQFSNITTLAPNATCVVTVQFKPLTSVSTGLKPETVSVGAGQAGTMNSTLSGTAN